jgi:hypothetical protein
MKGTRHQALIRGPIRALLGSMLVLGAMQVAAPVTFAATPPATGCSWGDVTYTIDTVQKPYKITHATAVSLAPHTEYTQATTMGTVYEIAVTVTGTISGTAEANLILGKASATASLSLQLSGKYTKSDFTAIGWKIKNDSNSQRRYVLFTAPHKVSGGWTKWQCTRFETWTKVTSGTYLSFDYELQGSSQCGKSYTGGTPEYLAQAYCPYP